MRGRKSGTEQKIEKFADWLAMPEEERTIKTQKEFAVALGVDEHTLVRWKAELAEIRSEDEIERFKNHLYRQAMKSNATAKHMELYAKLKGLFDAPKEPHMATSKSTAPAPCSRLITNVHSSSSPWLMRLSSATGSEPGENANGSPSPSNTLM